jgi:hypothetical protein
MFGLRRVFVSVPHACTADSRCISVVIVRHVYVDDFVLKFPGALPLAPGARPTGAPTDWSEADAAMRELEGLGGAWSDEMDGDEGGCVGSPTDASAAGGGGGGGPDSSSASMEALLRLDGLREESVARAEAATEKLTTEHRTVCNLVLRVACVVRALVIMRTQT